jgi:hypothetical protein
MPKGLITSLLLKLTVDYWYFTLIALVIKFVLIRYTAIDSFAKVLLIWITGTIAFYCIACLAGIIFTSGFYYMPFIMYIIAVIAEVIITSTIFKIRSSRLMPSILIGNGLLFLLLFMQML